MSFSSVSPLLLQPATSLVGIPPILAELVVVVDPALGSNTSHLPAPSTPSSPAPTRTTTTITSTTVSPKIFTTFHSNHDHGIVSESDILAFEKECGVVGGGSSGPGSKLFGDLAGREVGHGQAVSTKEERAAAATGEISDLKAAPQDPLPSLVFSPSTLQATIPTPLLTSAEIQTLITYTAAYYPNGTIRQQYFVPVVGADDGGVPHDLSCQFAI